METHDDTKEMVETIKELCSYCVITEEWQINAVYQKVTGFVAKWAVYWEAKGRAAGLEEAKVRVSKLSDYYRDAADKEQALPKSRRHQLAYYAHLVEKADNLKEAANYISAMEGKDGD